MYTCKQLCSKERTKLEMNILIKTRTIYNKLSVRYYGGKVGIIGVPFDKGQVNNIEIIKNIFSPDLLYCLYILSLK